MSTISVTLFGTTYDGVTVERAHYQDDSLALSLWDADGPLAKATVWLDIPPAEGCVWIKDWAENEGMLASLTAAGVIEPTGRVEQAGFTHVHEARVL